MACSTYLLSNTSTINYVYFSFRRCGDGYYESQFAVPPLESRQVTFETGTLVTAFETGYQIDPNGYDITE